MRILKTRQVGHSVVVTLPAELGYGPGIEVLIERMDDGDLRIMPASKLKTVIRERSRRVTERNREAHAILEEHDRQGGKRAHPAA